MIGLPILISIPHGGTQIPVEVKQWFALDSRMLFDDLDPYAREIFRFQGTVTMEAEVARAVVDVNRARTDLPPANPDGYLKTHTRHGIPVYKDGWFPDKPVQDRLFKRYYEPYHRKILKTLTSQDIQFALDCHTMTESGSEAGKRPMICLGDANGQACASETTELLAECLRKSFDLKPEQVSVNDPFTGGHIIKTFGNRPTPWVQVDINRAMFLAEPWYNKETMTVDPERIQTLNKGFTLGVAEFLSKAGFKARALTFVED